MSIDTPKSFHRLTRQPLDDSTIFESVSELKKYCNDGAAYNGQKARINFGDSITTYTQEYIIKALRGDGGVNVYLPIPIFNNAELNTIQLYNNETNGYDYYTLVYYRNANSNYIFGKDLYTCVNGHYCFSIMENCDLFVENNELTFYLEKWIGMTHHDVIWKQNFSPITGDTYIFGANQKGINIYTSTGQSPITKLQKNDDQRYKYYFTTTDNDKDIRHYVCPTAPESTDTKTSLKLYVKSNNYFKNRKVGDV